MAHSQGHSLSYEDVIRLETATAMTPQGELFLPSTIVHGAFAHAAMDTIHFSEEARTGKGTTHVLASLLSQDQ